MKGYKIGFSEIDDYGDPFLYYALIELEVPEGYPGVKYFNFLGKNRSNVARVLKINKLVVALNILYKQTVILTQEHLDSAFSIFDPNFYYHPGEIVYPDRFEDQKVMCAHGIHFFAYRQEAIDYVTNDWVLSRFTECALEKEILHPSSLTLY